MHMHMSIVEAWSIVARMWRSESDIGPGNTNARQV